MNTLRQHRKARRMTQYDLELVTGISQARICSIEKYGDHPSLSHARILAIYFGVKIEAMFPDGVQTSPPLGRFEKRKAGRPKGMGEPYCPPPPKEKRINYPRNFSVACWKCKGRIYLETSRERQLRGDDLTCPACGAVFEVAEAQGAVM